MLCLVLIAGSGLKHWHGVQVLVMTAVCVACAWLLTPVSGFLEDQILQVWLQVLCVAVTIRQRDTLICADVSAV